jgi:hypothetical protein
MNAPPDMLLVPATAEGPPPETDFAALKSEGIALAQLYSGRTWTDYNEHDPGVTILEQACYALTELGYRAGFDIEDLLASRGEPGEDDPFQRPFRRLTSEPVTAADYRKLLIDRLPELGNAWVEPSKAAGLYDLFLYRAPDLPGVYEAADDDPRLLRRARRLFVQHRSLCEDIATIRVLKPARLVVGADVAIEGAADPDAVMALILFRLGLFAGPEPRRISVDAARAGGDSLGEILRGPYLADGLIRDEALGDRPRTLSEDDVERHISAVPGVLGVRHVMLWPPSTHLSDDRCFGLDGGLDDGILPISLTVRGDPAEVDPGEVRRHLRRLWETQRRKYDTAAQLEEAYPPARGRARDTSSYQPIARQFPAVYGVGPGSLQAASAARQAQAKQLLAYLALFDRLMVDGLDRLSNLRRIMSPARIEAASFARKIEEAVPEIAALLISDGAAPHGNTAFPAEQQGRLLDFLLALQGEEPEALIPSERGLRGERRVRDVKRLLLASIESGDRLRGRGFDYLAKSGDPGPAGLEARARLLLGAPLEPEARLRPRIGILEHCLLRARGEDADAAAPAMAVSAVVHAGGRGPPSAAWRRHVTATLRAETPAHIALTVHFVDRPGWIRFKRLRKLWRGALRAGYDGPTDLLTRELRRFLQDWPGESGDG